MHSGHAVQLPHLWVSFKDVIYIINMSSGPEAEHIWKGEVQSTYYWQQQTEKHSTVFRWTPSMAEEQAAPSSRSFNTDVYVARSCQSKGRMLEISQGWDTRDSFLLPILSKHCSHPLSIGLYEEGNDKIFHWQKRKTKKLPYKCSLYANLNCPLNLGEQKFISI